jgi:hypothetical protein
MLQLGGVLVWGANAFQDISSLGWEMVEAYNFGMMIGVRKLL